MPTHSEIAGKLLKDAADFFRKLAEQNEPIREQMNENATVFTNMGDVMEQDPHGQIQGQDNKFLASQLLKDAADFFRKLAEQNEPIQEQMNENANVYEEISKLVAENPDGVLD